jgi:hypothetical protein
MPNADKMVIQHGKNIDYSVFGKENGNSIWWIEEQKVLKRYRATEVVTTESFTYTIGEILCGVQSAYRLTGVSDFEHGGYCVAQVWAKRTLRVREGGGGGGSPVDLCLVGSPNGPYGERARSYNFAGSDNEYERMLSQSWRSNGTKLPIGGVDAPGQVGDVTSHLIVFDGGWAPRLDLTTISAVDDLQHNSSPLVRIG